MSYNNHKIIQINGMSTSLELFYAERFKNYLPIHPFYAIV